MHVPIQECGVEGKQQPQAGRMIHRETKLETGRLSGHESSVRHCLTGKIGKDRNDHSVSIGSAGGHWCNGWANRAV